MRKTTLKKINDYCKENKLDKPARRRIKKMYNIASKPEQALIRKKLSPFGVS